MGLRSAALAGVMALWLVGCGGDDGDGLVLDGRPFVADMTGVLDAVSTEQVVIDGAVHPLGDELIVFSAATLARVDLAGRAGSYVQVGLEDGTVAWIATVGDVLPGRGVVLFEDDVAEIDGGVVQFGSGYRVAIADGVDVADADSLLVFIDPATDEIVEAEVR